MIIHSFSRFTGFKLIYDYYISAENAKELGFVDEVMLSYNKSCPKP
jgi:ATP-dependent protease ClpP protease subunit